MTCIVVYGPTACGKSDYALTIPNADIINGDSLQAYSDLNILTARPDPALPHHYLYGFSPPNHQVDVMSWRTRVTECIENAYKTGRTPVIVGGTGFYLNILINGIAVIPPVPESIIQKVRQLSDEALWLQAAQLDIRIVQILKDRQRIQRAVCVHLATSKSIFDWHDTPKDRLPYEFELRPIIIEKELLHTRINQRFEQMISQGALEEVDALKNTMPLSATLPIARALGFKEIWAYLDGTLSKKKMIELGQLKTRQYAKRQMTWMNLLQR
ncbi:MAG: tRNA (adenosine(37)-N6)-dimethylallyltransferase MiaA [Pseudomonadota bacterium]